MPASLQDFLFWYCCSRADHKVFCKLHVFFLTISSSSSFFLLLRWDLKLSIFYWWLVACLSHLVSYCRCATSTKASLAPRTRNTSHKLDNTGVAMLTWSAPFTQAVFCYWILLQYTPVHSCSFLHQAPDLGLQHTLLSQVRRSRSAPWMNLSISRALTDIVRQTDSII